MMTFLLILVLSLGTVQSLKVAPDQALTVISAGTYNIQGYDIQFTVEAVPEPSSTVLLGLGGLALILRRRN